ncbi:MAG: rhodanese-like domain-containing protein [Christensenellales bacterium]
MKQIVGFLLVAGLLCGCSSLSQNQEIGRPAAKLSAEDTQRIMEEPPMIQAREVVYMLNRDSDLVIVDVRTPEEYEKEHIPGSYNYPLDGLAHSIPQEYKANPVVVYCRSGVRSAQAAAILHRMGYEQVYDLGGLDKWPYETVSQQ